MRGVATAWLSSNDFRQLRAPSSAIHMQSIQAAPVVGGYECSCCACVLGCMNLRGSERRWPENPRWIFVQRLSPRNATSFAICSDPDSRCQLSELMSDRVARAFVVGLQSMRRSQKTRWLGIGATSLPSLPRRHQRFSIAWMVPVRRNVRRHCLVPIMRRLSPAARAARKVAARGGPHSCS